MPYPACIGVSVGEPVRITRELRGLSQNQFAELTGILQVTLSAIENARVRLGARGKVLARALKCHPAVLVFRGWEVRLGLRHNPLLHRTGGEFRR